MGLVAINVATGVFALIVIVTLWLIRNVLEQTKSVIVAQGIGLQKTLETLDDITEVNDEQCRLLQSMVDSIPEAAVAMSMQRVAEIEPRKPTFHTLDEAFANEGVTLPKKPLRKKWKPPKARA